MQPTTPAEMVVWANEEHRKAEAREKIIGPILWVAIILWIINFSGFIVLQWMGRIPLP